MNGKSSTSMGRRPSMWERLFQPAVILLTLAISLLVGVTGKPLLLLAPAAACVLTYLIVMRHDVLLAGTLVIVAIMVDWYQVYPGGHNLYLYLGLTLIFLAIVFMAQSRHHPWTPLPDLWLWGAFAILMLLALPRSLNLVVGAEYYLNVAMSSFCLWALGMQVVRSSRGLRQLFAMLTVFGTLIAIHSIIFSLTGRFLLANPRISAYLAANGNFQLYGASVIRAGSFLSNPDTNSTFLAAITGLALGLALSSSTRREAGWFWGMAAVLTLGLITTFSIIAVFALLVGIGVLLVLLGHGRLVAIAVCLAPFGLLALNILPAPLRTVITHADPMAELTSRLGAWTTALRLIAANPLTGVGLNAGDYYTRLVEPFRSGLQAIPLGHPHESYLEFAALAGIPTLLVFLALLGSTLRRALRNLRLAGTQRPLVAGAIAALATISTNALAVNSWTILPIVVLGWLIAGAVSTPAAVRASPQQLTTSVLRAAGVGPQRPMSEGAAEKAGIPV